MDKVVVCLIGPTACGKTSLACELVQHLPLEIISIDSGMVFRGMNIGTAKPDAGTLANAPHRLIDILDPIGSYSAAQCCDDVLKLSTEMFQRNKIPLLVGGTMMYFRALQQGLSTLPSADPVVRAQLLEQGNAHGWPKLHHWLTQVDPVAAAKIHPNDPQRIQRALEVYCITGTPLTALQKRTARIPLSFLNCLLMPTQREWLHARIAERFHGMLAQGLVEEVRALQLQWSLNETFPSMRSVGYRQVLAYIQGTYDYPTLQQKGVEATRQLAKRQLTWLRHWPDGTIYPTENPGILCEIMVKIKQLLDNDAEKFKGE